MILSLINWNRMESNRLVHFDFARSLCVLWIVGFWHLQNYIQPAEKIAETPLTGMITDIVLACFTCLSGFFLKKYTFTKTRDVLFFLKRRFCRFFILLIISVISYGLIIKASISTMLMTILGVSLLIGDPMQTLWYFSMIVFFYFITPLLLWKYSCKWYNYVVAAVLFVILILCVNYCGSDNRLLLYYPFFILGLFVNLQRIINLYHSMIYLVLIFVLSFQETSNQFWTYAVMILGVLLLLSICRIICSYFELSKIVYPIAFSSMCAYLFHRQVFCIFVVLVRVICRTDYFNWYVSIFAVLCVFLVAFCVQYAYNRFENRYLK